MKLHTLIIFSLITVFQSTIVQANDDSEHLIHSCQELVGIYAKRDEMRLAAGLTTSLSEALRAGYCKGVIDEYRRNHWCFNHDWFHQAQIIAGRITEEVTVKELLESSCSNYGK